MIVISYFVDFNQLEFVARKMSYKNNCIIFYDPAALVCCVIVLFFGQTRQERK